ncbi:TetR-like C-terminal domain-containing protein [Nocardioides sp. CER19]|uniref:TetR-like C-terminal domain-containing protein n=1 Tax=Nocardioides sp. CER19 TaxID=3038538 RepID=UPI002449E066|nr:TetR-like C-terminal domain-containing protein [Nocardioides sp. CER19]MDH2416225.1 TetR-like C-terminal domain-containing protein [Nocardioides sp. CER19]
MTRAGADLADDDGLETLTVSSLARRLEVKTPSLYTYVDGNADLRLRVTALALDEAADLATAAIASLSGRTALAALADAWREFARRHPGRYAATRQAVPSSGTDAAVAALGAGRRHADLLRNVLDHYPVAEGDTVHAVRLIGSVVHGFVSLELGGGFAHSDPPSDDSWDYALAALDRTLTR